MIMGVVVGSLHTCGDQCCVKKHEVVGYAAPVAVSAALRRVVLSLVLRSLQVPFPGNVDRRP